MVIKKKYIEYIIIISPQLLFFRNTEPVLVWGERVLGWGGGCVCGGGGQLWNISIAVKVYEVQNFLKHVAN